MISNNLRDGCDFMFQPEYAYTDRNFALNHYSFIDHFVVSSNDFGNVSSYECFDSGDNLSDHVPMAIKVSCV